MGANLSSDRSSTTFRPFIADQTNLRELTALPLIFGTLLGIVFGASSLYLVLKTGLTVSASIPVAVISITIFRLLSKVGLRNATILENNIVQTAGSAGESIAFGFGATMPAIMILGFNLEIVNVMLVGVLGGLLGILMMIPLRRALIVQQHGVLKYPEGTACAEVLKAGADDESLREAEAAGTAEISETKIGAKTIFTGFGIGLAYKSLMSAFKMWKEVPERIFGAPFKGGSISAEISPELLGVGYIIGPRVASYMLGGGVIAALVLVPMVKFFGAGLTTNIFPAPPGELIRNMSASQVFDRYVRYIAAGAVAMGGIISLIRSLPTIIQAFKSGLKDFTGGTTGTERTERDIPIGYAMGGVVLLLIAITVIPQYEINWISSLLILVFGFFFVTVSSRICGQIGSTSNPISGMTIATLLFTSLIFLLMGRMAPHDRVIALTVGAIVCVAAANAGNTSQDLKTGFLVGATPKHQQVALLVGALTSALVIGWTLDFLNRSAINILPVNYPGFTVPTDAIKGTYAESPAAPDGKTYRYAQFAVEVEADGGKTRIAAGKYLVGEDNQIHYLVNPGVGGIRQGLTATLPPAVQGKTYADQLSNGVDARGLDDKLYKRINVKEGDVEHTLLVDESGAPKFSIEEFTGKLDAPKAALMGVLVDGVLTQKLPWSLILIGAVISLMLEIIGVSALPVAVGIYLPISTSATIFAGGLIRALVQKLKDGNHKESLAEEETGKGVLLSSGLIAGGAIGGLLIAGSRAIYGWMNNVPTSIAEEKIGIGGHWAITSGPWSNIIGLLIFGCLAYFLFNIARKRAA